MGGYELGMHAPSLCGEAGAVSWLRESRTPADTDGPRRGSWCAADSESGGAEEYPVGDRGTAESAAE